MSGYLKVDRNMLIFALRYALNRSSYAPCVVVDNIKYNIKNISTDDIKLYIKDIKDGCEINPNCDKGYWQEVLVYLEGVLGER